MSRRHKHRAGPIPDDGSRLGIANRARTCPACHTPIAKGSDVLVFPVPGGIERLHPGCELLAWRVYGGYRAVPSAAAAVSQTSPRDAPWVSVHPL